jgi:hypothetical protein
MSSISNNIADQKFLPRIAKWFNNKQCAVSLRFDDNLDSHVKIAIPLLNKSNIQATFMINPGRNNFLINYTKHKDFWQKDVPSMGHRLGNHTWNHKGAKNLEEAEYEIGEASRLLWNLYPEQSRLNVFASGGGETWGGRRWHKASYTYKAIAEKYFLIDLYDGTHTRVELNSGYSEKQIKTYIETAEADKKHLAFVFHKIGNESLFDFIKHMLTGYNNCFSEIKFADLLKELEKKRNSIWIAPLIDILKYKSEYNSSTIELIDKKEPNVYVYNYRQKLVPNLYDHPLTLILPEALCKQNNKVYQDGCELSIERYQDQECIVNIKSHSGELIIRSDG